MKIASLTVAYNEEQWIGPCLEGLLDLDENLVLISHADWKGDVYPADSTEDIARKMGATIIKKDRWVYQQDQRNEGLQYLQDKGYEYAFIVDADELFLRQQIIDYRKELESGDLNGVFPVFYTFWKDINTVIDADEGIQRSLSIMKTSHRFHKLREVDFGSDAKIAYPPETQLCCYHFSYTKPNEKIKQKVTSYSSEEPVNPRWFDDIWSVDDITLGSANRHPAGLNQWRSTKRLVPPQEIIDRLKTWGIKK